MMNLTECFFCRIVDSDIIYLNLAGTPVIVVNSAQAAHDLFEKRSALYSDRYAFRLSRPFA